MFRLIETLKLIRVINCLMAMVGVWVGAYMTWVIPRFYGPAIAGLAAFFICAAGNVVNDLVDIELDRAIRPHRVLVKGTLSHRYAFGLAIVLNIAAVALAVSVSVPMVTLAVVAIGLLYLYNYWLKGVVLVGNLVVSLLAGLTFITGGVAVDPVFALELPGPLVGFVFALLFNLVREIIKDVQDVEGDRSAGIRTLAVVAGEQKAVLAAMVTFFLLVIASFVPVLYGWYSDWYKIIAIYAVELPLLAFLIFVWGNPTPTMLRAASALLKVGMALGFVALVMA